VRYTFEGKTITIPDTELEKSMKLLDISKDEAIQMWLEDNDYCENEEVEILTAKAKENKAVQHGAVNVNKSRTATKRERKPDVEKEEIISKLAEFLETIGTSVKITNKSKLIEFEIGENHYKVDLIKQRPPKKA
jgi:hypothetical protein